MKIVSVLAGTPVCISDNVRLTARRITRQRQAMKPDRREGFMGGDGRVHPLDRRRRASASRRLASGWPERSGGIHRAD